MSEEKTKTQSVSDLSGHQQQNAYLIVISAKLAGGIGRMFKLERQATTLGRSMEAEFQVEDDGISRKHARVTEDEHGDYFLMDLGSTNGTYLNGVKVQTAQLSDGDKIQIGSNTVLKFTLQDQLDEEYQRNIYESATRDGLTRIFNKKYFLDSLRKEFAYCVRHQVALSVVMFDVDFFKKVNDAHGHLAGDYVLSRIAQKVGDTVRTEDLFARYGGEEFALMLRESTQDQAMACAERCRVAVESGDFIFAGAPLKVTISLGVATLVDADFAQPDDLLASADKYLYRAKRAGRNCVNSRSISGP